MPPRRRLLLPRDDDVGVVVQPLAAVVARVDVVVRVVVGRPPLRDIID